MSLPRRRISTGSDMLGIGKMGWEGWKGLGGERESRREEGEVKSDPAWRSFSRRRPFALLMSDQAGRGT